MLTSFVILPILTYAGLVLVLRWNEDRFIYFPVQHPVGRWDLVEGEKPNADGMSEHRLESSDGVGIYAWYCSAGRQGGELKTEGVILYCHGNAGNLSDRYELLIELSQKSNLDVLAVDYRGYGKSDGEPSEEGLYLDVEAAWRYLMEERGFKKKQVVIMGKSLGGGPASRLARKVDPAGLALQSCFTSIPEMTRYAMPVIPGFIVRTQMNSASHVAELDCPKLFVHGKRDRVVPFVVGQALADRAAEPKTLVAFDDGGHNDLEYTGGDAYYSAMRAFMHECLLAE